MLPDYQESLIVSLDDINLQIVCVCVCARTRCHIKKHFLEDISELWKILICNLSISIVFLASIKYKILIRICLINKKQERHFSQGIL